MRVWPNVHRVYRYRGQLQVLRIPTSIITPQVIMWRQKSPQEFDLVDIILR